METIAMQSANIDDRDYFFIQRCDLSHAASPARAGCYLSLLRWIFKHLYKETNQINLQNNQKRILKNAIDYNIL
jgi:hypothetical protein